MTQQSSTARQNPSDLDSDSSAFWFTPPTGNSTERRSREPESQKGVFRLTTDDG